jgi:hypothetical protein
MLSLLVGGMKFLFPKLFVIRHMYIVAHAEEEYSVINTKTYYLGAKIP